MSQPILVTCALPYANGPLHLGHMVEFIQADIFVRTNKLSGKDCKFLCGSDAHGTPIMLSAEKKNMQPSAMVEQIRSQHSAILSDFAVQLDNFHTTDSAENKAVVYEIYEKLVANDDIETKIVEQAFDEERQMFLADRYIKGACPRCKAQDQYGDSCEVCGATYSTRDIINPVSILSGKAPIFKPTEQLFFKLKKYQADIQAWLETGSVQSSVKNKLAEWFTAGIENWCISRDAPYFGFLIPGHKDKYFYVWLDAPIGYIASLRDYQTRLPAIDYWDKANNAQIIHFIGKDVAYFHALFWPGLLKAADLQLPHKVNVHGFLTINGEKMSKSRGTFITAEKYEQHLPTDFLRYYIAAKLSPQIEDIDLNLEDFMQRVNSDLVGKYINIASRSAKFINKSFSGMLSNLENNELFAEFTSKHTEITTLLLELKTSQAVREIMTLADKANQYAATMQPWVLAKEDPENKQVQAICTQLINYFMLLSAWLKPIIPEIVAEAEKFLNCELDFSNPAALINHKIEKFTPLAQRITTDDIAKLNND
jgi:methionyl-tRNA synthetase